MLFDMFIMAGNFGAILVTIIGVKGDSSDGLATPSFPIWIIYALMLVNPFFSSGGTIAMRKMKKFSEYVVSWYLNWSILLSAILIMVVAGLIRGENKFAIFTTFEWPTWLMGTVAGISIIL